MTYCVKLAYLAAREVAWQQLDVLKVFQLCEYCNGAMGSATGGFLDDLHWESHKCPQVVIYNAGAAHAAR